MDIVRDLLDKLLTDRHGVPVGRVDGLVMMVKPGEQPRITAIEVGSVAQARRLHVRLESWAHRMADKWGHMHPNPHRIAWSALSERAGGYRVNADAASKPTLSFERWLRKYLIDRIPGS